MSNRFENISILIFFLASIGLSYSLIPVSSGNVGLDGSFIIQYEGVNDLTTISSENIQLLNHSYELVYSLDGGKSYRRTKDMIRLNQNNNASLQQYVTGVKWKAPYPNLPNILSLRFYAEYQEAGKRTSESIVTRLGNFKTKLPIVSLNCNQDFLFDPLKGVMISGENGSMNSSFYTKWYDRPGNYTLRGKEHSSKANLQYFIDDSMKFETNVNLRIAGNATRRFPQKSLRIDVEEEQNYNFFGEEKTAWNSIVLRNSGNDNSKTMFADFILQEFAQDQNVLVQRGQPSHIFINGNYWGIYNLRERINRKFIAEKENVKEKEVTILENGNALLKSGSEEIRNEFLTYTDYWNSLNTIDNSTYIHIKEIISMKSLIDYIFFETFYGNADWPNNNIIWYKAGDKKWKWLLNDLDLSLAYTGSQNTNSNYFEKLKSSNSVCAKLFCQLLTNHKFKEKFVNRAKELISNLYSEEAVEEKFQKFKNWYSPEITWQIKRWRISNSVEEWIENVSANEYFLKTRTKIYLSQLENL
ncbi:MAG: CotH kinase family protein [Crocinitomicaceae bacterium]|nr:CotH kinase family protein [Crocinitomicaceae bacterium]